MPNATSQNQFLPKQKRIVYRLKTFFVNIKFSNNTIIENKPESAPFKKIVHLLCSWVFDIITYNYIFSHEMFGST